MLIAGTQSGCGKTTVTLALMQYFRAQHQHIAPFKAGPDYLDPMWHEVACGRTSYNLDTRMVGITTSRTLWAEKSLGADMRIIEGVMGLFDGVKGVGGVGSSADLAKQLAIPVLLVVSAKGMSGSIVPLVEGFVARAQAMDVNIVGIVANHVGSENHAKILRELLVEFALPPLFAWVAKNAPTLPERHLGLQMPYEWALPDFSDCLHVEDAFAAAVRTCSEEQGHSSKNDGAWLRGKKIAVAKDAAFCFMYPANIEWLKAQGACVDFFSPLRGEAVPHDADALWLPGGYPELHLEALSMSPSLPSMVAFIEKDRPVLAECGGMMVLGEAIDGVSMAGVLPCSFAMQDRLAGLGYRQDVSGVRGHEFHHSKRQL
ncbi:MAG: cobyrinate a,c-diamide synthase, partial [Mariprofundaceae bacterium]|nr:cobyrinate a,c-diamide synthase [Mariprofundaceae bacterium]